MRTVCSSVPMAGMEGGSGGGGEGSGGDGGGEDGGRVDARPAAEEALIFGIAVERCRVFEHEASARDVLLAIKLAVELRAAVCVLVCLVVALWRDDRVVG